MQIDLNQEEIGLILEWHRRAHSGVVCSVRSSNLADRLKAAQEEPQPFPVSSVVLVKDENSSLWFYGVVAGFVGKRYLIQTTNWDDSPRLISVHESRLKKP